MDRTVRDNCSHRKWNHLKKQQPCRVDTGERIELVNDSRKGSGKRIFTEGRVVEARTVGRVSRLQCGLAGSAGSRFPGGNTTI